jgi:hypothetical protein
VVFIKASEKKYKYLSFERLSGTINIILNDTCFHASYFVNLITNTTRICKCLRLFTQLYYYHNRNFATHIFFLTTHLFVHDYKMVVQ